MTLTGMLYLACAAQELLDLADGDVSALLDKLPKLLATVNLYLLWFESHREELHFGGKLS